MIAVASWLLLPVIFLAFLLYALGMIVALLLDRLVLVVRRCRKSGRWERERLRDDPPNEEVSHLLNGDSSPVELHEGVTTTMTTMSVAPDQERPSVPDPKPEPPVTQPTSETYASFISDLQEFARKQRVHFSQQEAARLFFACYYQAQQRARRERE